MLNITLQKFQESKKIFNEERSKDEGFIIMNKVIGIVNELGKNFIDLDGGELEEIRIKLIGYKFYLADYITHLNQVSEQLKLEMKNIRSSRWEQIAEDIKAIEGKVKNKEQIENILIAETKEIANEQIFYETTFYQYKIKLSAIDDIVSAIMQRVAELKRQVDQSKII